jgi:hypothetical protein
MGHFIDITGNRFGRWRVLAVHPERDRWEGRGRRYTAIRWLCRCDCGTTRVVLGNSLRMGKSKGCGCGPREKIKKVLTKHGLYKSRAYRIWQNMQSRCFNPNASSYDYYGGRGITVCEDWRDFRNFFADMLNPPPNLSIESM